MILANKSRLMLTELTPTLDEVRFRSPQMTNPAAPRAALSPMVWIKSFCRNRQVSDDHSK